MRILAGAPIITVALSALLAFSQNVAADDATKANDVCSLVPDQRGITRDAVAVTVKGDLGKSFHLGMIITDRACGDKFIRVVFPSPDEKNLYARFQEFSKMFGTPGTEFSCVCSGGLKFIKGIPILNLEDAQVLKRVEPHHD